MASSQPRYRYYGEAGGCRRIKDVRSRWNIAQRKGVTVTESPKNHVQLLAVELAVREVAQARTAAPMATQMLCMRMINASAFEAVFKAM